MSLIFFFFCTLAIVIKEHMKALKNINWLKFLVLAIVLASPIAVSLVFAQPAPPPPPPPPPAGVPIDGGIALLLGGLTAYGAKKYLKK